MSQFAQAMERFAATYTAMPRFIDAARFMEKAAGMEGFTLDLTAVDIGTMVSIVRRPGDVATSFLSLGQSPVSLTLRVSREGVSETVTFLYAHEEWACTTSPHTPELMGCVRFAKDGIYRFDGWTLDATMLDFPSEASVRQVA